MGELSAHVRCNEHWEDRIDANYGIVDGRRNIIVGSGLQMEIDVWVIVDNIFTQYWSDGFTVTKNTPMMQLKDARTKYSMKMTPLMSPENSSNSLMDKQLC